MILRMTISPDLCQWLPEVRYSSLPMLQPRPPAFQKIYLRGKLFCCHHHSWLDQCLKSHTQSDLTVFKCSIVLPVFVDMFENWSAWSPLDKVQGGEAGIGWSLSMWSSCQNFIGCLFDDSRFFRLTKLFEIWDPLPLDWWSKLLYCEHCPR